MAHRFPEPQAQRCMGAERIALGFSGGGTAHHCVVSHDPIMIQYARRPKRTKLQLELWRLASSLTAPCR